MLAGTIICLALPFLAARPGPEAGTSQDVFHRIWSGEYALAVSTLPADTDLDPAALLGLAGDYEAAFELLDGAEDALRTGFSAYKAGCFGEAAEMLDGTVANPFLEGYRLYYRALSLSETGRTEAAVAELERFFEISGREPAIAEHPAFPLSEKLIVEAAAGNGPAALARQKYIVEDRLSAESLFILSGLMVKSGEGDAARKLFLRGLDADMKGVEASVFTEAAAPFEPEWAGFARGELMRVADAAMRAGAGGAAGAVLKHILDVDRSCPRVRLLRARLFLLEDKPRMALKIYRSLFDSTAPVSVKKEALIGIASTLHRVKKKEESAESYRLFGLYYPGDRRSIRALDTAARLKVSMGRWTEALRIWSLMRKRGTGTSIGKEAALSEAVLRFRMGDPGGSTRILEELLPTAGMELEPAVIYWLARTAGDGTGREAWVERMRKEHPSSFYAVVLEHGQMPDLMFVQQTCAPDSGESLDACLGRQMSRIESSCPYSPLVEAPSRKQIYEAFRYFLELGFGEEALQCAAVMKRLYGGDELFMRRLYRDARSKGMVGLSMSILGTEALFSRLPNEMSHPVAYSAAISEQAANRDLSPALLLAVIREESRFDRRAVSHAGAIGLMQLMPGTGLWVGRKLKRKGISRIDLLAPEFNIEAGGWYLQHLAGRCRGSLVAVLASYNAGEARMRKWRKMFKPEETPVAALEMIGLRETRNYVRRVLNSFVVYRAILSAGGGA